MARKQTAIWTTATGEKLRLCDMNDHHLLNTIAMLRRHAESVRGELIRQALEVEQFVTAEEASFFASKMADRLLNMTEDDLLLEKVPIFEKMLAEAERRGLEVPHAD